MPEVLTCKPNTPRLAHLQPHLQPLPPGRESMYIHFLCVYIMCTYVCTLHVFMHSFVGTHECKQTFINFWKHAGVRVGWSALYGLCLFCPVPASRHLRTGEWCPSEPGCRRWTDQWPSRRTQCRTSWTAWGCAPRHHVSLCRLFPIFRFPTVHTSFHWGIRVFLGFMWLFCVCFVCVFFWQFLDFCWERLFNSKLQPNSLSNFWFFCQKNLFKISISMFPASNQNPYENAVA